MATEAHNTSEKEICGEVGLEETNGKAIAKLKCRVDVLLGSNGDSHYGDKFDTKNHLGKAEESKLLRIMH